jgi:hypothetical protein
MFSLEQFAENYNDIRAAYLAGDAEKQAIVNQLIPQLAVKMLASKNFTNPFEPDGDSAAAYSDEDIEVFESLTRDYDGDSSLFQNVEANLAVIITPTTLQKVAEVSIDNVKLRDMFQSLSFEGFANRLSAMVESETKAIEFDVLDKAMEYVVDAKTENLVNRVNIASDATAMTKFEAVEAALARFRQPLATNNSFQRVGGGASKRSFINAETLAADVAVIMDSTTFAAIAVNNTSTLSLFAAVLRTQETSLIIDERMNGDILVMDKKFVKNTIKLRETPAPFIDSSNLKTKVYRHEHRKMGLRPQRCGVLITSAAAPVIAAEGVQNQNITKSEGRDWVGSIAVLPAGATSTLSYTSDNADITIVGADYDDNLGNGVVISGGKAGDKAVITVGIEGVSGSNIGTFTVKVVK